MSLFQSSTVSLAVLVLIAVAVLAVSGSLQVEAWGATSPGTMVQLNTSHVPTDEDVYYYTYVYPERARKEITAMTGGDPGPIRAWSFLWGGA